MSTDTIVMCDRDPTKEAVYSYEWDWGEKGFCCAEQRQVLEQGAKNLNRRVIFTTIKVGPAPMELPERAAAHGKIYALEHELGVLKARNAALGEQLRVAAADSRTLLANLRTCEATLGVRDVELEKARVDLAMSERARADLSERLSLATNALDRPSES